MGGTLMMPKASTFGPLLLLLAAAVRSVAGCGGQPANSFNSWSSGAFGPAVVLRWGPSPDGTGTCLGASSTGMFSSGSWMAFGPSGTAGMSGGGQPVSFQFRGSSGSATVERRLTTAQAQPGSTTAYSIVNATAPNQGTGGEAAYYGRADLLPQGRKALMFALSKQSPWPAQHNLRTVLCADFDTPGNSYEITSNYAAGIAACNFAGTTGASTGSTTGTTTGLPASGTTGSASGSTTAAGTTISSTTGSSTGAASTASSTPTTTGSSSSSAAGSLSPFPMYSMLSVLMARVLY